MSTLTLRKLISAAILAVLAVSLIGLSAPTLAAPLLQLTPFPTPTPGPDGRILYIVQPNDTLLRISLISGVSVEELRQLNNFTGDNIQVGQQLLLGMAGPEQARPEPGATSTPTPILPTPSPEPGFGELCVLLFEDKNGDAIRQIEDNEDNEPSISGGAIAVSNRAGTISLSEEDAEPDDDEESSAVCYKNLPEGDYTVTIGVPDGHNPTTVTSYAVELSAGDKTYVDFGAQKDSENQPQETLPEGDERRPILGIVGGLLLLSGAGLAVFAGRLMKGR